MQEPASVTPTPLRVLIIEDSPADAKLLLHTLRRVGFEPAYQEVVSEAEYLRQLDTPFDLILADYSLPSFTAPMALRHLRQRELDIPFIVITGTVSEEVAVECMKEGAADYLLKDRLVRLGEAVRQALAAKELRDAERRAARERERLLEQERRARAEAEAQQERLQSIFLQAPAMMAMTSGPDHVLELANTVVLQTTCRRDVIGKPVRELFPELEEQGILRLLDEVYRTGTPFRGAEMPIQIEHNGIREQFYFTFVYQPVRAADGTIEGVLFHGIDVTEQVESRQQLEQRTAEISNLNEALRRRLNENIVLRAIDLAITSNLGSRASLEFLLDQAVNTLKLDAAALLVSDGAGKELRYSLTRGFRTGSLDHLRIRFGESIAGAAAAERRVHYSAELSELAADTPGKAVFDAEGFTASYALPLLAKGRVQGVLELFRRSPLTPDDEWQAFAKTISNQAAIALDNARLLSNLRKSNQDLVQAYDANIEAWARALDLRDHETEGHSRRVTELTVRLAQQLGLGERERAHIRRGALLHDIGKIGVPDKILLKPGKLEPDEWAVMQRHPVLAHELLSPIDFLAPALDIPYAHHEKWDGSGYPRGLRGTQIPLAARIFAVVDVYDALTSDRPYRKAWSRERTLEYIQEQSGSHFDPRVVEAFLALVPSGPDTR